MNRIQQAFSNRNRRTALIPFLTAGDPNYDLSLKLFDAVLGAGADIVEIGIPYSDPLADGPVIQAASLRSLNNGFSLPRVFELTTELRKRHPAKGLILFTYVNPVIQFTPEKFFAMAQEAGADGAIIPDLPLEESAEFRTLARLHNIALIPLVTPVSPDSRIQAICESAEGFVYCVSALGVTGVRQTLSNRIEALVQSVRRATSVPVSVGFGVSTPEQAKTLSTYADGVIVGSAVIRKIEDTIAATKASDETSLERDVVNEVVAFINSLVEAMA